MAKRNREQAVEEKRTLKRQRKQEAAAARAAAVNGGPVPDPATGDDETSAESLDGD